MLSNCDFISVHGFAQGLTSVQEVVYYICERKLLARCCAVLHRR